MTDDETDALAKAVVEVERQFPSKIDPRYLAVFNLVSVAGMVYGGRVAAMVMEGAFSKARQGRAPAAPVAPPPPPPSEARPGPHTATVHNPPPHEATGQTSYRKVPDGLVDISAYQAAREQMRDK